MGERGGGNGVKTEIAVILVHVATGGSTLRFRLPRKRLLCSAPALVARLISPTRWGARGGRLPEQQGVAHHDVMMGKEGRACCHSGNPQQINNHGSFRRAWPFAALVPPSIRRLNGERTSLSTVLGLAASECRCAILSRRNVLTPRASILSHPRSICCRGSG